MEVVKKEENYTIYKKRSGRFSVKGKNGSWITGDPKVEILLGAGLVKLSPSKKKEAAQPEEASENPAAEAPAEEKSE